jgi:hypothetical protein
MKSNFDLINPGVNFLINPTGNPFQLCPSHTSSLEVLGVTVTVLASYKQAAENATARCPSSWEAVMPLPSRSHSLAVTPWLSLHLLSCVSFPHARVDGQMTGFTLIAWVRRLGAPSHTPFELQGVKTSI